MNPFAPFARALRRIRAADNVWALVSGLTLLLFLCFAALFLLGLLVWLFDPVIGRNIAYVSATGFFLMMLLGVFSESTKKA